MVHRNETPAGSGMGPHTGHGSVASPATRFGLAAAVIGMAAVGFFLPGLFTWRMPLTGCARSRVFDLPSPVATGLVHVGSCRGASRAT